jgi:ParB family chromosome partitioning protein
MTRESIEYISVALIDSAPQVRERFDDNETIGLAMSLRALGQLVPVRLRRAGDRFVVVDGERRLRAARKAGIETLAAIVEDRELDDAELLHRQISINVQRADLSPEERANSVARLMETTGWSAAETAKRLGISSATVSKLLTIRNLPASIKADLAQGKIPLSTAYELAKVEDPVKQGELAVEAANGRLKREEVGAAAKGRAPRTGKKKSRRRKPVTATLGPGCSLKLADGSLSLAELVSAIEAFLAEGKAALEQGTTLNEFLAARKCKGAA